MQCVLLCLSLFCGLCPACRADDVRIAMEKLSQIINTDAGEWKFQHPAQPGGERPDLDDSAWTKVRPEHQWEGENTEAWYRKTIVIPQQVGGVDVAGQRLILRCAVDDDGELFVNGQSRGRFHWDQGETVLTEHARPGEAIVVAVRAINGPVHGRLMWATLTYDLFGEVRQEAEVHRRRLAFCSRLLDSPQVGDRRSQYEEVLNRAALEIDFSSAALSDRQRFRASLERSLEALRPFSPLARHYSLYLVGHAHIDMNWLWLWPETKEVCRLTWDQALKFMDEYPQFRFTQSQPGAYIAIEEEQPELFSRIQAAAREGQWEPAGAGWVEGDTNMASGEILARHCLLTDAYYREKLGRRSKVAWLPDNFGHAWTVPSILSDAGYRYFYFCRAGKGTPLFWWEGPDGARLLAYQEGWYNSKITDELATLPLGIEARAGLPAAMVVYGVGDHGGGPTRQDIETARTLQEDPLFPNVHFSTAGEFFAMAAEQAGESLPRIQDELNFTFEGCYTTHSDIKRWNRTCENLLPTAETLALVGTQYGVPYPAESFRQAWRNACFNQFHDILPGTAIHGSYDYSRELFEQAKAVADRAIEQSLDALAGRVNTEGEGAAVLVWNPVAWERTDYCRAQVTAETAWEGAEVRDAEGKAQIAEIVAVEEQEGRYLVSVGFVATLPAMGYEVFHLRPAPASEGDAVAGPEAVTLTGDCVAHIDSATGLFSAAVSGREPFATDCGLDLLQESGTEMSAWTIGRILSDTTLQRPEAVELVSNGPVSRTASVTYKFQSSTLEQLITTYAGLPRVDISLRADWQELGSRELGAPFVKAAFTLPVDTPQATFEIPFGAITRPANGHEVPGQRWIDVSQTRRTPVGSDRDSAPIDLTAEFNEDVIAAPQAPLDGDFDGGGRAYSSEILTEVRGETAEVDGVPFRFPPVTEGRNNSVRCLGQTIQFVPRRTGGLAVFGASSNGTHGGTARLIYETGPPQSMPLSLTDWCLQPDAAEIEALSLDYRFVEGRRGEPATRIWMRRLAADATRPLSGIVLPNAPNLHIMGLSFSAAYVSRPLWGVSLVNDCKYGFDVRRKDDGRRTRMRMSLLRASYDPDPMPDRGEHEVGYSLYPHQEGWRELGTPRRALEFNRRPICRPVETHGGPLPPRHSFLSVEPPEMVLSAFKPAETGSGYVLRVYNTSGAGGRATLRCALPFDEAVAVNILEEPRPEQSVNRQGDEVALDLAGRIHSTVKLAR